MTNDFRKYAVKHLGMNGLALDHLRCHTACCNSGTAAKCLELAVTDDLVVIDIKINTHNIATFRISDCTDTTGVLDFSYVSWVGEVFHNLFTVIYNLTHRHYLLNIISIPCMNLLLVLLYEVLVKR